MGSAVDQPGPPLLWGSGGQKVVGSQASLLSAQVLGTAYQSTEVPMYVPVYLPGYSTPTCSEPRANRRAGRQASICLDWEFETSTKSTPSPHLHHANLIAIETITVAIVQMLMLHSK